MAELVEISSGGEVFLNLPTGERYKLRSFNPLEDREIIIKRIIDTRPDPAATVRATMERLADVPAEVRDTAVREIAQKAYQATQAFLNREPPTADEVQSFLTDPRSEEFRAWLLLRGNDGMTEAKAGEVMRSMDRTRWERAQGEANRQMVELAKQLTAKAAQPAPAAGCSAGAATVAQA